MAIPRGFTPDHRGPSLADGTGGSSERPSAREVAPILRDKSAYMTDIRLTPTSTDVSTGTPAVAGLYDFGPVSKESIGRYFAWYQDAASATADGLGEPVHCEFQIYEASAGVFEAVAITDLEGGAATSDADDTRIADATYTAVADAALDGTGSDARATFFVATAADVADAAAWTATPATLVQGNLYLLDAHAASTRVHNVERRH